MNCDCDDERTDPGLKRNTREIVTPIIVESFVKMIAIKA